MSGTTLPAYAAWSCFRTLPQSLTERMTLAGFPPTSVFGGTSFVTTDPAATTEFSRIVTPPTIVASPAIQTFLSITIGLRLSGAHDAFHRSEPIRTVALDALHTGRTGTAKFSHLSRRTQCYLPQRRANRGDLSIFVQYVKPDGQLLQHRRMFPQVPRRVGLALRIEITCASRYETHILFGSRLAISVLLSS